MKTVMNKPFEKILILSDYDGTFAGKNTRIVQKNLDAIKEFQSLGGKFTFSTGRLPSMMRKVYPQFDDIVNAPLIMCNGAMIYDAKREVALKESFFDGIQARADLNAIREKYPSSIYCYADDGTLQRPDTPELIVGDRFRKMALQFSDASNAEKCRDHVNAVYKDRYHAHRSSAVYLEIVDKNVSKGRRISYMKEYYRSLGIDGLKVLCIGDYENDIDMLSCADAAFCPSNAIDEVKTLCDHVLCDHDEGAVAHMIELIKCGSI